MRVIAEVPAWMVADGEYGDVAVGMVREFGFALIPSSSAERHRPAGLDQPEASTWTVAAGVVVRTSTDVPPVLDTGVLLPVIASVADPPMAGVELEVHGRLLVEPFHWENDGLLWPAVPEGVRLWTVREIAGHRDGTATALDALPPATEVDHDAIYSVTLERP